MLSYPLLRFVEHALLRSTPLYAVERLERLHLVS
jgi:hypothetical protein